MIDSERFYKHLCGIGVDFFTGVPDSLLKSLLLYIQQKTDPAKHIITANEGLAIALASGYYLSTGKPALVYMQNSGLGNTINPLTSLADTEVYGIPMILLVGWRGMPGTKDEPQHIKMGRVTDKLLEALEIPYFVLNGDEEESFNRVHKAASMAVDKKTPVAILVPDKVFEASEGEQRVSTYPLSRQFVLERLIERFDKEVVVCSTGKCSRELFELNQKKVNPLKKIFLTVGSMGLANHIALGINLHTSDRVVMIDGDGAVLMHMGSIATVGKWATESLVHIIINNGCHESVGAQPTLGFDIDVCMIGKACGYTNVYRIVDENELVKWLDNDYLTKGKQLVEIRVNVESWPELSRPRDSPADRKNELMASLLLKSQ